LLAGEIRGRKGLLGKPSRKTLMKNVQEKVQENIQEKVQEKVHEDVRAFGRTSFFLKRDSLRFIAYRGNRFS